MYTSTPYWALESKRVNWIIVSGSHKNTAAITALSGAAGPTRTKLTSQSGLITLVYKMEHTDRFVPLF